MTKLLLPLAIAVGTALFLLGLRKVFLSHLKHWTHRRYANLDDLSVAVIRGPSIYWCLACSIYVGIELSELGPKYSKPLHEAITVIVILSVAIALANLAVLIFSRLVSSSSDQPHASGLMVGLIRGSIIILGGLVILSVLGVSIAPLLTALGVGGLAVALALKDTLENLFAGIYLITDRTIRVGDYIKLESGQEGRVEDIGWRTTRIRLGELSTVITPNSKLSQGLVTNYCLPDRRIFTNTVISVDDSADPQAVEETLLAVVHQSTEDVVGVLSLPEPNVRFGPGTRPGIFDFVLSFSVRDYNDQTFTKHELRKRIYKQFKEKNIPLPKPVLGGSATKPS